MVGMPIADAVGAPLEFTPVNMAGALHRFDRATMTYEGPSNRFRLLPGQWTDDASMGFCIADSLIVRREYDGSDMRVRFHNWWTGGYNNAFRNDKARGERSSVG